jgi:hypothetical protein
MYGEILFIAVRAHHGTIEPSEDIPVEVPQVVAFRVVAVVGKLD